MLCIGCDGTVRPASAEVSAGIKQRALTCCSLPIPCHAPISVHRLSAYFNHIDHISHMGLTWLAAMSNEIGGKHEVSWRAVCGARWGDCCSAVYYGW